MSDIDGSLVEFERRFGYRFKDSGLLALALTHSSCGKPNNKRLELLGDAVLDFVTADWLFDQYPDATEAELHRRREEVVNNDLLARLAKELGFEEVVQVSAGYRKALPDLQPSTLADAFEAVIGAIYRDGGMSAARELLVVHLNLQQFSAEIGRELHPKNELQELSIKRFGLYPVYAVANTHRKSDDPWQVTCALASQKLQTDASGRSKLDAETKAAIEMLKMLKTQ